MDILQLIEIIEIGSEKEKSDARLDLLGRLDYGEENNSM